jgi:hypothetical protein
LIRTEEKELEEIEARISTIKQEMDDQKLAIQAHESILMLARHLDSSAKTTIDIVDSGKAQLSLPTNPESYDPTTPNIPPSMSLSESAPAWNSLMDKQAELLRAAESTRREASQRARDAEREVESHQSMLYFRDQTLNSLLDNKQKAEERILQMKDVISSRRRIPDEIWVLIFMERVKEDEEPYTYADLPEPPPFTVLRLSWVCRLWRTIILEQPVLWRYIAVPFLENPSTSQWHRVQYFRERVGAIAPYVYTVRPSKPSRVPFHNFVDMFEQFTNFGRLKLNIESESTFIGRLVATLRPTVQDLTLVGELVERSVPDLHLNISPFFHNVKFLRCIHVLPFDLLTLQGQTGTTIPHLETIDLDLHHVSPARLISLLRNTPSLTTLVLHLPWTHSSNHVTSAVTLVNITSISCDLRTLTLVFDSNVSLPKLSNLSIEQVLKYKEGDYNDRVLGRWDSFISVENRRDKISSLGLSSSVPRVHQIKTAGRCSHIINSLQRIECLVLTGSPVVPALEELAEKFPPSLVELTVTNSKYVEEVHINAFIKSLYERKVRSFSLKFDNCPSISEESKQRFSQLIANLPNQG